MDPFGATAALDRPNPPGHIISAQRTKKDEARVCMNVAAPQERKEMRRRARERKQLTHFTEAACCLSAVAPRAVRRKNGLYKGSARGNRDPRESQWPFQPNLNGFGNRTTTLRRLLIDAVGRILHTK